VESAQCHAFHTVWVRLSVFALAVDRFCLFGLGLGGTGLLRGWLLSFVQAWEGEIRDFVHRRRSSQDLFYQSQVIPRFQKAWAGYSTVNDRKILSRKMNTSSSRRASDVAPQADWLSSYNITRNGLTSCCGLNITLTVV
jgi:hypothetical protein